MKLHGHEAIEYAAKTGATLHKFADPTEGARSGLSIEEARRGAEQDPNLIWCETAARTRP